MLKRTFDILISFFGLLILSPLFFTIAILIWARLGRPIFFTQKRPGFKGTPFKMVKFRTMLNTRDEQGNLLANHKRLTPLGRFLRSTSLDELPELWNVLKGDMSLVGPRPLLVEYLPLYTEEQFRRHEVKPGITGWAQINGRNAITWEERFALDIWYVDNQSIWLDIKILLGTIKAVFTTADVNASETVTMPTFKGTNKKGKE